MTKLTINITEHQREVLIKIYTDKVKSLEDELIEAKELLNQLTNEIQKSSTMKFEDSDHIVRSKGYDTWSIPEKIVFMLKKKHKCLTTKQIVDLIHQFEGTIKENFYSTVSGTISNKIREDKLFNRYKPSESSEYFIGLKEWFDENNNILDEYKAN